AVEQRTYWSARPLARSETHPREGDGEIVQRLHETLAEAVRLQMVSDVPLGAFLSGGVDSSLIVSLMQRASPRPVRTFSIGIGDGLQDETPFARRIAAHLGTDHTELRL